MPPFRLVMLGTGRFAVPTFEHLLLKQFPVIALITQPDRPQGRKKELIPARIKEIALAHGIPVHQPENVNSEAGVDLVRSLNPDLLVTAAYGQILSSELLSVPPLGGINLHGSVLPKFRGAAPVARAIEAGELETGVTVIRMSPQVDAGGMIAVARTPIKPNETAGELEARLAQLGAPLIGQAVEALQRGDVVILPQEAHQATKARKLTKEDGLIDWTQSAQTIHNLVRAMQPWPTASTTWQVAQRAQPTNRLIVHRSEVVSSEAGQPGQVVQADGDRLVVKAGDGAVRLLTVQVPGKKPMAASDFLRGASIQPGDLMGSAHLEDSVVKRPRKM